MQIHGKSFTRYYNKYYLASFFILLFSSLVTLCELHRVANFETTKQWSLLTYNLPLDFPANNLQLYNPQNVVATGFAIAENRMFLATPRLFSGVPATLSSIPMGDTIGDSPILQAYPNWGHHAAGKKQYNCSGIGLVSVYRIRIDSCNRLWALDAGVSRAFEDSEVTCPPKIIVYDLKTDQVVRRIDFPREVIKGETLYTNMIIDETTSRPENNCDDVFVYITDTVKPAIVVYDSRRDLTWRVSHPSMYPDPNFGKPNILGHRFTLMDGIVGLAFDAYAKVIYFQPLATDRLFSITTSALRAGPLPFNAELPVKLVGKKSSQGIGLAVSPIDGSIFFSPMSETAVEKWNPSTNIQSVLAYDADQFQFVADIRITTRDPSSVYVLSSKFHRFFLKNLEPTEINTRLIRIDDKIPPKVSGLNDKHFASSYNSKYTIMGNILGQRLENPNRHNPNGVYNKTVKNQYNPKRPEVMIYKRIKVPKYRFVRNENYYNVDLGDFSGLRITKSVSYNTSTLHLK